MILTKREITNVGTLLTLFLVGLWIGTFNCKVIEVEKIVIERREVLDFTQDSRNLYLYAGYLRKTIVDEDEAEQLEQKWKDFNKKMDDKQRAFEAQKHEYWQEGYMQGYGTGMVIINER